MAEANSTSRSTKKPSASRAASRADSPSKSAPPSNPVVPPGELSKVIAELQTRLANVEKKGGSGARKKKTADATANPPNPAAITHIAPPADDTDEIRRSLKDRQSKLDIEEAALRTRLDAAAQEEFLIHQEMQTLQLKLQSFRQLSRALRGQESELATLRSAVKLDAVKLAQDKQALQQARQELEQQRQTLAAERTTIHEREAALASPLAAMATHGDSIGPPPIPVLSAWRIVLITSLAVIALAAAIGLSAGVAIMTVEPAYRATATVAPMDASSSSISFADHFTPAMLAASRSLLEQRGLRPFDSDASMAQALSEQLTLNVADGKELNLSLDSPRRDEAVLILEALSRSYVNAHADSKAAITRAAAASLAPIRDGRLWRAFLCLMVMAIFTAAVAYALHRRATGRSQPA